MTYPLPFERLSALKDTLIIGPGVESVRFRFDSPPALPASTQALVLDPSGYFGVKPVPVTVGDVSGPGSSTNNDIATFSGTTGKIIKDASGITAVGGEFAGVSKINGLPMPIVQIGDVRGPGGSAVGGVPVFSDMTGKNIVQSSVFIVGSAVSGVASINGDSVPSPIGDVVGPAGATDTALAVYNGVTGKVIKDSTATLSPTGVLSLSSPATSGVTFANPTPSSGPGTLLSFYNQQHFTTDWVQNASSISTGNNLTVARMGNVVFITVQFQATTQVGAASDFIATNAGVPTYARPTTTRTGSVGTYDPGNPQPLKIGYWIMDTTGIILLYSEQTNAQPVTPWSGAPNAVDLATNYHTNVIKCDNFSLCYTLDA